MDRVPVDRTTMVVSTGNKEKIDYPHVATAGVVDSSGFSNQRIGMSVMAELKGFAGREKNEERARNWISKVKSVLLRDQSPDAGKCLVFSDLFTGPERDWYTQLSRSTRTSWKASWKASWPKMEGRSAFRLGDSTTKPVSDRTILQWSTCTV